MPQKHLPRSQGVTIFDYHFFEVVFSLAVENTRATQVQPSSSPDFLSSGKPERSSPHEDAPEKNRLHADSAVEGLLF